MWEFGNFHLPITANRLSNSFPFTQQSSRSSMKVEPLFWSQNRARDTLKSSVTFILLDRAHVTARHEVQQNCTHFLNTVHLDYKTIYPLIHRTHTLFMAYPRCVAEEWTTCAKHWTKKKILENVENSENIILIVLSLSLLWNRRLSTKRQGKLIEQIRLSKELPISQRVRRFAHFVGYFFSCFARIVQFSVTRPGGLYIRFKLCMCWWKNLRCDTYIRPIHIHANTYGNISCM